MPHYVLVCVLPPNRGYNLQKFNCDKSLFDFLERSKLQRKERKKNSISVDPYACSYVANCISEIRTKLNNVSSKLNLATRIAGTDAPLGTNVQKPEIRSHVENEISNPVSQRRESCDSAASNTEIITSYRHNIISRNTFMVIVAWLYSSNLLFIPYHSSTCRSNSRH